MAAVTKCGKLPKMLLRCVSWIAGVLVALMVLAQILLSPSVCASLVEKYYPGFIDGTLKADRIYVSLFRHFPAVTANVENLSIIYPASRFDSLAADRVDTLASFGRFTAAVNVLSLLRGTVNVKTLELIRPRAFIRIYDDSTTNLSVLKLSLEEGTEEAEEDSSVTVLPRILLRRVRLGEKARIVYVDDPRDVRATVFLNNFSVKGMVASDAPLDDRFRLDLDTLVLMGRAHGDTLLFGLDHFILGNRRGRMKIDAEAKAYALTRAFGRIKVPFSLEGRADVEQSDSVWNIGCRGLDVEVATVEAMADMDVEIGDRIGLKGSVKVPGLDFQTLLDEYVVHFYPEASKIHTTAILSAGADVDGWYDPSSGELPSFSLKADLAPCRISHSDYDIEPALELHASSSGVQGGAVDIDISKLVLNAEGIHLLASGGGRNILKNNGSVFLDADLGLSLDTLDRHFPELLGVKMRGSVDAEASGSLPLSGLSVYNLRNTDIRAGVDLRGVALGTDNDSLELHMGDMAVKLALMEDRFKISNRKDAKTLGAVLKLDSLSFRYCDSLDLALKDVAILAQTSPIQNTSASGEKYNPLSVSLSLGKLSVRGADSLSLRLVDSKNRASVVPSAEDRNLPLVRLSSENKRLSARSGPHRLFLSGLGLSAESRMNKVMRKGRFAGKREQADTSFSINALRRYLARWKIKGGLNLDRLIVATPAFPLRTSAAKFRGSFDNESIKLDSLRLRSGGSRLDVGISISDIRKALSGRAPLKLELDLVSDTLAISELLNAYAVGQKNMETDLGYLANADDENYENMVVSSASDSATVESGLIEVPRGLDAVARLRGRGVSYSNLNVDSLSADLIIRNRCLQVSGVMAHSQVGDICLDAFYSTETRNDVYAGFDLQLNRISAGEVIALMPEVDTLMPLLKSFDGLLNCNVAATAQIDTAMNLIMPSLEGVVRITGEDLHFNENKEIARIARLLWFKNPGRATIDSMTVEGILRDNTFELFPFLIKMDRWSLAVAGLQNMDKSFSYHVSMAKTPFLIKLGANITGPDFDHMSFKLGKAIYRTENLPSFSTEIDQSRTNLVESIQNVFRRGVRQAVMDNRSQRKNFQNARDRMGYRRSVSLEALEELSGSDRRQLDSLSVASDAAPDSLKTAPVAVTGGSETAPVTEDAVDLK